MLKFLCLISFYLHVLLAETNEQTCTNPNDPRTCTTSNETNLSSCQDINTDCAELAKQGKCITSQDSSYMQENCKKSCGSCISYIPNLETMKQMTEYGVPQEIDEEKADPVKTMTYLESTLTYMKQHIEDLPDGITNQCINQKKSCTYRVVVNPNECDDDDMKFTCGPACRACEEINKDPDEEDEELMEILREAIEEDDDEDDISVQMLAERVIQKYGVAQEIEGDLADETLDTVKKSILFMKDQPESCRNKHKFCAFWGTTGECESNKNFMKTTCGPSCFVCARSLEDILKEQIREGEGGVDNYTLTLRAIAKHGVEQEAKGDATEKVIQRLNESLKYMSMLEEEEREMCRNYHALCGYWAMVGECDKNVDFMKKDCAPSCFSCGYGVGPKL